jgi:SPP1 gp7 family putative phage head morphogenesis protein
MAAKPKTLPAIHPNAGLEREFKKKLERMIEEMQASVTYWICSAYKQNKPEMAQDASPAATLTAIMKKLARKWNKKFADAAPDFAKYFATAVKDRTDASLKAALKKSGFTVAFVVTKEINDILSASVAENVSLIKTISQEYLSEVEQMVMRSVTVGRDLGGLRQQLQDRYGITKRRATLIARQSNNNAFAMLRRAREKEIGVTKAIWRHSHAGRVPRPEHEKWDGTEYDVHTGKWSEVSQKYVWPGTDYWCRCSSRSILPSLGKAVQPNMEKPDLGFEY